MLIEIYELGEMAGKWYYGTFHCYFHQYLCKLYAKFL